MEIYGDTIGIWWDILGQSSWLSQHVDFIHVKIKPLTAGAMLREFFSCLEVYVILQGCNGIIGDLPWRWSDMLAGKSPIKSINGGSKLGKSSNQMNMDNFQQTMFDYWRVSRKMMMWLGFNWTNNRWFGFALSCGIYMIYVQVKDFKLQSHAIWIEKMMAKQWV